MRNIYFFETREEAKAKVKEMKKRGNSVVMSKESTPYKADDGRLFYYSVMWVFWYKTKNFKKIKNMYWQWRWTRLLYNQDKRNKEKPKMTKAQEEKMENLYNEYSYLRLYILKDYAPINRLMSAMEESAKKLGYRFEIRYEEYEGSELRIYRLVKA